jgi:predicted nucleic acid-binding protein
VALTHLVDASVLKRLSVPAVRAVVEPLAGAGRLARAGISDLEVGYSARNAREWDRLVTALDVFMLVETTVEHIARAKQVQRHLASKSQRGRKIPDLLVAAAAEAERLTVLHYDQDFDQVAKVTGQSCEWVVRAGSIDSSPRHGQRGVSAGDSERRR